MPRPPATKCTLRINGKPLIAAGKEWKPGAGHVVFMLDDNNAFPRLIQFGAGRRRLPAGGGREPDSRGRRRAGRRIATI